MNLAILWSYVRQAALVAFGFGLMCIDVTEHSVFGALCQFITAFGVPAFIYHFFFAEKDRELRQDRWRQG